MPVRFESRIETKAEASTAVPAYRRSSLRSIRPLAIRRSGRIISIWGTVSRAILALAARVERRRFDASYHLERTALLGNYSFLALSATRRRRASFETRRGYWLERARRGALLR